MGLESIELIEEDGMAQELTGLEYLKKKEIKNMKCDMDKQFAFISYSHDNYDSQIVMNVFKQLMKKGHNLWIDTANMPADEHTWKKSARDALRNKNCKIAFFFRSESSMVKNTIAKELETIRRLKHIKQIVTVDIWHEEGIDAGTYYTNVLNDGTDEEIDACDKICESVDTECKAIRLAGDAGNDILSLVEEMEEELKAVEGTTSDSDDDDDSDEDGSNEDDIDDGEIDDETNSDNKDDSHSENEIKETVEIVSDGSIFHIKGRDGIYDAFYCKNEGKYTVLRGSKVRYSENYTPKKIWEQNKNNITEDGYLLYDIGDLTISAAAKLIEGTVTSGKELDAPKRLMSENESYTVSFEQSRTVGEAGTIRISNEKKSEFSDGYHYYIFEVEYRASRRGQANLMYDTFKALTDKYPEKVSDIVEKCTSVAKKDDVSCPGTRDSKPPYFRMCKEFTISGVDYVVGSSYGFEPKIAEIYKMIDACGEETSVFRLEGYEHKQRKAKINKTKVNGEEKVRAGEFEYELWNIPHTASKMSDMMHDVFDLIAEKYPNKIQNIATSEYISSVARKEDVDGKRLAPSKLNYFRAKREHDVGGTIYYVGTSYNRPQGIGQLERMLKLCEGNADGLRITLSPEKSSHSGGKTGKKGLDELLN